jgi:hypothetical protein
MYLQRYARKCTLSNPITSLRAHVFNSHMRYDGYKSINLNKEKKMKSKIIYIIWGIVLLAAGGALLAGFDFEHLSQQFKLGFFAVASCAFFVTYYLHGVRSWGWLFPALFCAAIVLNIGMELSGMYDSFLMDLPIVLSLAAPFYIGYLKNRKHWGLLIPANILAALTVFSAVIPYVNGQLLSALLIYATGLPYLVLYLLDHSRRWALITIEVLAVCGTMPLLEAFTRTNSEVKGLAFLSLVALCFFVIAIWSKKNWWAIIPGGFFASLGLVAALEILVPHPEYPSIPGTLSWGSYIWVLFLALAATFGAVWLLRKSQPTGWAKYPAAGMLAIAVLSFIEGAHFAEFWLASLMLVIGVMFLLTIFTRKNLAAGSQAPKVKA